ncbi:ChrR family anti-sigma-E factor [Rhodovibrionaceae bacterium A322]
MTYHGQIPDEWILAYAAGQLSDAKSLLVASHIDYHDRLKARLLEAEALGGSLLDSQMTSSMSAGALDNVMSAIDGCDQASGDRVSSAHMPSPASARTTPSGRQTSGLPGPLSRILNQDLMDLNWRMMGPGMKQIKIWSEDNGECLWLLRAKGGTKIPEHDHRGLELTLVLQGSYHVGDHQFKPGDLEVADQEIHDHRPMIDPGQECICLVVTDAPLRLHSFFGRLVQPLIGL